MAETKTPVFLFLLSSLLALLVQCHIITAKPGGLTIELIHRNDPQSPFYQPNLTHKQRIQALTNQSIARAQYLKNMTTLAAANNQTFSYSPETVRMLMNLNMGVALYSVKIGIGTIPTSSPQFKVYNLVVDTASDLTWLQCEECEQHRCFAVVDEPFPSSRSTSYQHLPCNAHPLCQGFCIGDFCSFERTYADRSFVAGYLSSETFSFDSSTGPGRESIQGLVFGCAIDSNQVSFAGDTNQISGVLGLGFGPRTFVSQLDPLGQSNGRFSYCLRRERIVGPITSYLKFGADIQQRPDLSVTGLRRFNTIAYYYINLLGISVNGHMLPIPPEEFAIRDDGTGGSMIDSGSTFTRISRHAHDVLVSALEAVFAASGEGTLRRLPAGEYGPFELCYEVLRPEAFLGFPIITFNLQNNANMHVDHEAAFLTGTGASGNLKFCLAMLPESNPIMPTSIGAFQQTNYRFIYDTKEFKLYFGPENCFASS
ncbi:hypothetical protein TB1_036027 [Malus domestica]